MLSDIPDIALSRFDFSMSRGQIRVHLRADTVHLVHQAQHEHKNEQDHRQDVVKEHDGAVGGWRLGSGQSIIAREAHDQANQTNGDAVADLGGKVCDRGDQSFDAYAGLPLAVVHTVDEVGVDHHGDGHGANTEEQTANDDGRHIGAADGADEHSDDADQAACLQNLRGAEFSGEHGEEDQRGNDDHAGDGGGALGCQIAVDVLEVVGGRRLHVVDDEGEEHEPHDDKEILVLSDQAERFLQTQIVGNLLAVSRGLVRHDLLAEDKAEDANRGHYDAEGDDKLRPAGLRGAARGQPAREYDVEDDGAEHNDKTIDRHRLDLVLLGGEGTGHVNRVDAAESRGADSVDHRVHDEQPDILHSLAGVGNHEHQGGKQPLKDDEHLIGSGFAPPGMSLVQDKAKAEVSEGIDDLGNQEQRADDRGVQTDDIRAVERDVHAQDHVDGRRNAAGGPHAAVPDGHPLSGAVGYALLVEFLFSCHGKSLLIVFRLLGFGDFTIAKREKMPYHLFAVFIAY